jgi:hypothetical protein
LDKKGIIIALIMNELRKGTITGCELTVDITFESRDKRWDSSDSLISLSALLESEPHFRILLPPLIRYPKERFIIYPIEKEFLVPQSHTHLTTPLPSISAILMDNNRNFSPVLPPLNFQFSEECQTRSLQTNIPLSIEDERVGPRSSALNRMRKSITVFSYKKKEANATRFSSKKSITTRFPVTKVQRKNWDDRDMIKAMRLVRSKKMSTKEASEYCNVPRSTLWDRLAKEKDFR